MSKFWVIVRQVVRKNLKSATYIILLLTPIIAALGFGLVGWIANQTNSTPEIAMVSNSPAFRTALVSAKTNGDYKLNKNITTKATAEKQLANQKLDGYLTVTVDKNHVTAVYKSRTNGSDLNTNKLSTLVNSTKTQTVAASLGLNKQQLSDLFTPASLDTQSVTYVNGKEKPQRDDQQAANTLLAMVMTVLIYIFLTSYAGMIAQEIATEKGSHIMEILVSSVAPRVQFFAKVTAMALLILFQVLVTAIAAFAGAKVFGDQISFLKSFNLNQIQPNTLVIMVLFFIIGLLLYTTMAAGLGALVARSDQVSQATSPLMIIGFASYGASFVALNSNAILVKIGSYVPFLSQSIMPVRFAVGHATVLEAYISIAVAAVSVGLSLWFALHLYERNVLSSSNNTLGNRLSKLFGRSKKA